MPTERKQTAEPEVEKSPQKPSNNTVKRSDLFGFGKILDKLPLYKLSARMAYCMFFDLILLLFVLILRASGTQVNEFPNAWDFRFILVTTIVVFFVGLGDLWKGRHK
ncbi:hypothetical protein GK047_20005 [Paenibacillus sp. SYP-B3998]|uniref:Uncharacterized protein n=1 Tax=Paenibacillus sp. SYP-B3998 TaxID=2678564 RepID=A0A6G4A1T3_9BACL|nr:hypothetical protein [Paenibacillus sp. SYP-B3998]NEW08290.1 hypothetical protein [Paenibacillus sp. SYP-B3998]